MSKVISTFGDLASVRLEARKREKMGEVKLLMLEKEVMALIGKKRFRNIYLGMTEVEVEDAVLKDTSISSYSLPGSPYRGRLPSEFARTKIGPYSVDITFRYNKHGVLCVISLLLPEVAGNKIGTILQKQINIFYEIFLKKFGEPVYTRKDTFGSFPREIDSSDFNQSAVDLLGISEVDRSVPLYLWQKDNVGKEIFLIDDGLGQYGMGIRIIDEKVLKFIIEEERKREQEEGLDYSPYDF